MDKYKIDSHKLMYHVSRVNEWLCGRLIYPIYIEISPSGTCNHRCMYCALDYMGYQKRFLDTQILMDRCSELARLGIKSIMYAGEGEPLLHKDIGDIVVHTRKVGIEVAITTNGVLLSTDKLMKQVLGSATWVRISINGGTKETYAKIHKCSPEHFDRVMENLSRAVKIREKEGLGCTIGAQLVLLPENWHEVELLAGKLRDTGVNYLVIKPYSQHLFSHTTRYKEFRYSDYFHIEDKLRQFNSKRFHVVFRRRSMEKWDNGKRSYSRCLALPFWSYIDAGGNVWGCSAYLGDERFLYGNIYKNTFAEIWGGEKRRKSLQWVEAELNTLHCRVNCRMDEVNRYLWELKNLPEHVNFI